MINEDKEYKRIIMHCDLKVNNFFSQHKNSFDLAKKCIIWPINALIH